MEKLGRNVGLPNVYSFIKKTCNKIVGTQTYEK